MFKFSLEYPEHIYVDLWLSIQALSPHMQNTTEQKTFLEMPCCQEFISHLFTSLHLVAEGTRYQQSLNSADQESSPSSCDDVAIKWLPSLDQQDALHSFLQLSAIGPKHKRVYLHKAEPSLASSERRGTWHPYKVDGVTAATWTVFKCNIQPFTFCLSIRCDESLWNCSFWSWMLRWFLEINPHPSSFSLQPRVFGLRRVCSELRSDLSCSAGEVLE